MIFLTTTLLLQKHIYTYRSYRKTKIRRENIFSLPRVYLIIHIFLCYYLVYPPRSFCLCVCMHVLSKWSCPVHRICNQLFFFSYDVYLSWLINFHFIKKKNKYELDLYNIIVLVIAMIILTLPTFYFIVILKFFCKPWKKLTWFHFRVF